MKMCSQLLVAFIICVHCSFQIDFLSQYRVLLLTNVRFCIFPPTFLADLGIVNLILNLNLLHTVFCLSILRNLVLLVCCVFSLSWKFLQLLSSSARPFYNENTVDFLYWRCSVFSFFLLSFCVILHMKEQLLQ